LKGFSQVGSYPFPDMAMLTDEDLVRSVAAGREEALHELMERHRARVQGYLRRRLPSIEDAEEATQDVFVKIRRGAGTFNGGRFGPWCGAIARNVLRDRLRRLPERPPTSLSFDPVEGIEVWERIARADEIRAAMARIPAIYRAALAVRYVGGLSYREAAEELGLSRKGYETRLARAKVMIRRALLAMRGEGE
jgi:RNA polymerase sigma-70 factor (ECF subfamily)